MGGWGRERARSLRSGAKPQQSNSENRKPDGLMVESIGVHAAVAAERILPMPRLRWQVRAEPEATARTRTNKRPDGAFARFFAGLLGALSLLIARNKDLAEFEQDEGFALFERDDLATCKHEPPCVCNFIADSS